MEIDPSSSSCFSCNITLANTGYEHGHCPECERIYDFGQRTYAMQNPQVYLATFVNIWGNIDIVLNAAEQSFRSQILSVFGQWAVTSDGIECLGNSYSISKDRLNECDWIDTLQSKSWVDLDDFTEAFEFAKSSL